MMRIPSFHLKGVVPSINSSALKYLIISTTQAPVAMIVLLQLAVSGDSLVIAAVYRTVGPREIRRRRSVVRYAQAHR